MVKSNWVPIQVCVWCLPGVEGVKGVCRKCRRAVWLDFGLGGESIANI